MSVQNSIRLVGRLTRDPEIRTYESNGPQKVASFSLAVDRYTKKDHPECDFFDCSAFRSNAEFIEKYFRKGDRMILEGEGHFDTYEDKEGNKRKSFKVIVNGCTFGSSKGSNNDTNTNPTSAPAPEVTSVQPVNVTVEQDDLPW